jgi:hypothetical protein
VSAAEWWLIVGVIAAALAALAAIAGLGATADRVGRALGHASVGLVAVALILALP